MRAQRRAFACRCSTLGVARYEATTSVVATLKLRIIIIIACRRACRACRCPRRASGHEASIVHVHTTTLLTRVLIGTASCICSPRARAPCCTTRRSSRRPLPRAREQPPWASPSEQTRTTSRQRRQREKPRQPSRQPRSLQPPAQWRPNSLKQPAPPTPCVPLSTEGCRVQSRALYTTPSMQQHLCDCWFSQQILHQRRQRRLHRDKPIRQQQQ